MPLPKKAKTHGVGKRDAGEANRGKSPMHMKCARRKAPDYANMGDNLGLFVSTSGNLKGMGPMDKFIIN